MLGLLALVLASVATFFGACTFALLAYNVVPPAITGVQLQRNMEAWQSGELLHRQYAPVRRDAISDHLAHAAVAAEDGRFYQHGGIDWDAIKQAREDNARRKRRRGGSTITQQLAKNLFLTTHPTYVRKGLEVPLTYLTEIILPKERILTLYLNVIEWGPGVFGAEAAAQHHYGIAAAKLSRQQSARLAACIPAPRSRRPQSMGKYGGTIETRMRQMGW